MKSRTRRVRVAVFNVIRTFRVMKTLGISLRVRIRLGRDSYPAFWISLFDCDFKVADLHARLHGGRRLPISETPHVEFLSSHETGASSSAYRDYRALNLPPGLPDSLAFETRFLGLREKLKLHEVKTLVQIHVAKGDSIPSIVDGLHRASIAYVSDSRATVKCICPVVWVTI